MIKKRVVGCFFILLLLLNSLFVSAQLNVGDLEEGLDKTKEQADNLKEKIDSIEDYKNQDKWVYLSNQWKEFLLRNKVLSFLDSSLKKLDGVFFVLMKEHYDFSLSFFFLLIIWIIFGHKFGKMFSSFLDFKGTNEVISYILSGTMFSVLMSYLGVYNFMVSIPGSNYFADVVWWMGILIWIFFILFLVILVYSWGFITVLLARMKLAKDLRKASLDRHKLGNIVKGIDRAAD